MALQIQNNFFLEKIKTFLRNHTWREFLVFLFFLLLASGFWLLLYLQQIFELDIKMPVSYKNLPVEVALKDSVPTFVNIKIQDKGTVLLNYYTGNKFNPIELNLKEVDLNKNSYPISNQILDKEINKRLATSSRLLSFSPQSFTLNYSPMQEKRIPVKVDGIFTPAKGYMIFDTIKVDPSEIIIYGTEESLSTINMISSEKIKLENISGPVSKQIKLVKSSNFKLSTDQVEVFINAEEYTEKTLNIPIICHNIPSDFIVRLFPSTVEIIFQVSLEKYKDININDFQASVDYNDLTINNKQDIMVNVDKKPDWLQSYRISPEKVEFLIEEFVQE